MSFLLLTARKDLRRRLADLPALLIWIGLPLAIGGLLVLVSGGSRGTTPKAKVLLADQDQSGLSRLLSDAATSGLLASYLDLERVSLEDGRRRIAGGEATALLVVPKGFSEAIFEETPCELRLLTNPSQRILPGIVQEGLEVLVEGVFYAQRLFGEPLRRLGGLRERPTSAQISSLATALDGRLRAIESVATPPVLTLETRRQGPAPAAAAPNLGLLFLPGTLLMSVLFIAQGTSGDLWREKQRGTLRRARALPVGVAPFLGGKLLAGTALVGLVALSGLAVAAAAGVPVLVLPLAWLWCVFTGSAVVSYFLLLQVLASSERGAQLLGTIVLFPLVMIGGSFFPFEAMPAWMRAVGRLTPNGAAVARLREILDGRTDALALLLSALAIGLPALAALWVCARRVAGRFPVE